MKRKRDTTTNVKHAESIERVEKEKKYEARPRYLIQTKYCYLKREKMTKNVQCRNGYVNHWEAQPPYIANYEFSSTEHGE